MKFMINLGSRVKDVITGFKGIATAHVKFLHGCSRIQITPEKLGKNGSTIDAQYFDEPQVIVLNDSDHKAKPTHGPMADPQRYKLP